MSVNLPRLAARGKLLHLLVFRCNHHQGGLWYCSAIPTSQVHEKFGTAPEWNQQLEQKHKAPRDQISSFQKKTKEQRGNRHQSAKWFYPSKSGTPRRHLLPLQMEPINRLCTYITLTVVSFIFHDWLVSTRSNTRSNAIWTRSWSLLMGATIGYYINASLDGKTRFKAHLHCLLYLTVDWSTCNYLLSSERRIVYKRHSIASKTENKMLAIFAAVPPVAIL